MAQQHPHQHQDSGDSTNKQEFDTLKSRFLQSQMENERLKKEIANSNLANKITTTPSGAPTSSTTLASTPNTTAQTSTVQSTQSTGGDNNNLQQQQQQTQPPPPTAYITPSRITKVFIYFYTCSLFIYILVWKRS